MTLIKRYEEILGQVVNPAKSTFYSGSISTRRVFAISDILGFKVAKLPFTYLGVSIFIGKP